jgi:hypothetical protein
MDRIEAMASVDAPKGKTETLHDGRKGNAWRRPQRHIEADGKEIAGKLEN